MEKWAKMGCCKVNFSTISCLQMRTDFYLHLFENWNCLFGNTG